MVPAPRPVVDLRSPPPSFDDLIDWLESWSYALVLLENYPVADLRAAIMTVGSALRAHRASTDPWVTELLGAEEETSRTARVVLHDHEWFVTSLDQFDWFLRVVEGENHGGHRQALGQYGRVLAEALRRHRHDERGLAAQDAARPRRAVP